jgi:hypothetical protein
MAKRLGRLDGKLLNRTRTQFALSIDKIEFVGLSDKIHAFGVPSPFMTNRELEAVEDWPDLGVNAHALVNS